MNNERQRNKANDTIRQPWFIAAELICLMVIPFIIFVQYPVIYLFRWGFMFVVAIYAVQILKMLGFTAEDIGIRRTLIGWEHMAGVSILALLVMLMINAVYPVFFSIPSLTKQIAPVSFMMILIGYCVVSVPLQEFLFRGYLQTRFLSVSSAAVSLGVTALIFGFVHSPFGSLFFVLSTLLMGIYWGYHFYRHRNLWLVMISHCVLGGVFLYFVYH